MQVSLWQQFSSNHSDTFWVVGAFDSPELAAKATETIRALVARSQQWYRQEEYERRDPENLILLPELEANSVTTWEHFLFVYSHHTEDYKPTAYKSLIRQLGGQVAIDFDSYGNTESRAGVRITCQVPQEGGQHLYEVLDRYIDSSEKPPWAEGSSSEVWGKVRRDGQHFILSVEFTNIEQGLPELVRYLRAEECTAITYQLSDRGPYERWEGNEWDEE